MSETSDQQFTDVAAAIWPSLYRTAYLLCGNHADAEDLVQTALGKTYAARSHIRDIGSVHAYARVTLINTSMSSFRRRRRIREVPVDVVPEVSVVQDYSTGPAVRDALSTLTPRQRAVVVLRFYLDLDVRQTAHILGCAEGTVKSQTALALSKLRTQLQTEVAGFEGGYK
ncbi:MAG: sigE 12 [Marmoricola sp.]|nr:sigE 12 [Marmoricola sp.]